MLLEGAKITLELTILAQLIGVILGIVAALAKTSKILPLRILAEFYIWLFRGTPVLVQLLLWYNLLSQTPEFTIALIALGLNEGAYMAEIVRAGIISVDEGRAFPALVVSAALKLTRSRQNGSGRIGRQETQQDEPRNQREDG